MTTDETTAAPEASPEASERQAAGPRAATDVRMWITGTPRGGKSTEADRLGADVGLTPRRTDELLERVPKIPWGEDSVIVSGWFDEPGPWIVEGVTVVRALRKWLAAHPEGKPCDVVVLLEQPVMELTKGQETMRKGIATVWNEIRGELEARGVAIETR